MEELLFIQQDVMPALIRGLWVSIQLIIPSALCGLIIGILVGALRVYGNPLVAGAANGYSVGFPWLSSSLSGISACPTSGST